jgi:hypothetical protein
MSKSFITIKATRDALKLLRKIAAETGDKQYEVLERALQKEWDNVQEEKQSYPSLVRLAERSVRADLPSIETPY